MDVAYAYLRVSYDRHGNSRSPAEQATDLKHDCQQHRWQYSTEYSDPGLSASRYTDVVRDGWVQLLRDLPRADVLLLWEGSRGSRKPAEWEQLIELTRTHGIGIWVHTDERLYRPWVAGDARDLRRQAADAAYESDRISERSRRSVRQRAGQGLPHGWAPYGFRRIYHEHTGQLLGQQPEPAEAAVVRELFERIAAGHSLRSIAVDFERRGIRTRPRRRTAKHPGHDGLVFSSQHLYRLLRCQSYAGRRAWKPKDGKLQLVPASWPALVDPALFDRVQRLLSDPARKTVRLVGYSLLGMTAVCDVCSGGLTTGLRSEKTRHYRCHRRGCVQISQPVLDELAQRMVLQYLSRPDIAQQLSARAGDDHQSEQVRQQLEATRLQLAQLHQAVADQQVTVAALTRAEPVLVAQVERLEAQLRQLSTPVVLQDVLGPAGRWEAATAEQRRQVCRLLLTPTWLGQLRVRPGDRKWCADCKVQTCLHTALRRVVLNRV